MCPGVESYIVWMKFALKSALELPKEATMITQAYTTHPLICNLFSLPEFTPETTIKFSPKECGYEIDEDELASEMLAQFPDCPMGQTAPEVDPEEFEKIYGWFLS
jgi:hypothetical protein